MVAIEKEKNVASSTLPVSFNEIFWTKRTYQHVAADFHKFHRHDGNVFLHFWTTTLGVWGSLQLAIELFGISAVYAYVAVIALTTPIRPTAICHTALVFGLLQVNVPDLAVKLPTTAEDVVTLESWHVAVAAIVSGYGLQDLAHFLCSEPTFMQSYLQQGKAWMLLIHSLWLLPLVIDAVVQRSFFLPYAVTRNRNLVCKSVASRSSVEQLREWIHKNVPNTFETTHVWPHQQDATTKAVVQLENDATIHAAFHTVFPVHHYDVLPVQEMNEIYVTALSKKKPINSDAVFYTPHTDGPFWWLPGASLYRVLVGVTPNSMVRTRFNLQHDSYNQVLDMYNVVGFDYNRELHWIDHVPGAVNTERRSLVKLHFIVYPKGWHRYGKLCAYLNTSYNTWARGNFLKTLRPTGVYENTMAWWIWLTTWTNAVFEEYFGWSNLVYIATAYMLGPTPFLLLTSFRHYVVYIATFANRQPMVALGYFIRDSKLYKTLSMMHLLHRLLPMVELPHDLPGLLIASLGFGTTMLATARLGVVRTYFGTELGVVKPKWISGFPYGVIPHPMIVGQLFAFSVILLFWRDRTSAENATILVAHMTCYTVHMIQEMLFSSY